MKTRIENDNPESLADLEREYLYSKWKSSNPLQTVQCMQ